jgi:hypothetical protein
MSCLGGVRKSFVSRKIIEFGPVIFFLPMQCFISSNKIVVRCKAGTQIFTTVYYDARFIIYMIFGLCVAHVSHPAR